MTNICKAQQRKEQKLKAIKEFLIKGEVIIGCLRFAVDQYSNSISFFLEKEYDSQHKKQLIVLHNKINNIISEYENLSDTFFDQYEALNKSLEKQQTKI